jgi:glyoxylase-like metal-dependent hydrolase (beta-lactamase superfamily II)
MSFSTPSQHLPACASVKYLVYSHHHFDHIAGGKAITPAEVTTNIDWWPPLRKM